MDAPLTAVSFAERNVKIPVRMLSPYSLASLLLSFLTEVPFASQKHAELTSPCTER